MLNPPEKFAPAKGLTAPVTATLDFHVTDATLVLRLPAKQPEAMVEGKTRPLAADFSAPISYYEPPANLFFVGIMGALRAARYEKKTELYFLQPYDPDRILWSLSTALFQLRSTGCRRLTVSWQILRYASITNFGSSPIPPVIPSSIQPYVCAKNWPR